MKRSTFLARAGGAAAFLGANRTVATADRMTFTPDLQTLWQTLIEVGADPFRTSDRSKVEAVYRSTLAQLDRPLTSSEFYIRTASLFSRLNDGHVDVFPSDYVAYTNAGGYVFPLRVGIDDHGLWIRQESAAVPFGSRIVELDGRPESELRSLVLSSVGGQTHAMARHRARSRLPLLLYELDGSRPSFNLTYRPSLEAAPRTAIIAAEAPSNSSASTTPPYTYVSKGNVGYIDYRECVDASRFADFLKETFATIKSNGIASLVIDVRANGGGSSALNNQLWSYVSDKPFKQFGGVAMRSSGRLKREFGQQKYTSIYGLEAWEAPDGKFLEYHSALDANLQQPAENPLRFHGRAVLLIGAGTLSSAMECAVAAKDYELATLVGEETGDPVVSTGEIYATNAPETGLHCTFTTKVFFGPKARPDGQGVLPDVEINPAAEPTAALDPVLERGIAIAAGS